MLTGFVVRGQAFGRLLGAMCLALLTPSCGNEQPAVTIDPETQLSNDPRIQVIFNECVEGGYYDRDTTDPVGLLIPKLGSGRGLPLSRAIEGLGRLGDASAERLAALVAAQANDPQESGAIQNTIAALGLNRTPRATEALIGVLGHPQSLIRVAALRALEEHSLLPEHYDTLLGLVYFGIGQEQTLAVRRMFLADPHRGGLQFVDWLREGRFGAIEESVAEALATIDDEQVWEAALAGRADYLPRSRTWIDAGRARRGDPAGLEALREALADPRLEFRSVAVRAAVGVGVWPEVAHTARVDPDPGLRASAVAALGALLSEGVSGADPEAVELARATLRAALDSNSPESAEPARRALLAVGDAEATERTLAMLDGGADLLSRVLPSLPAQLRQDERLASRVERRAIKRIEAERHLPIESRQAALQILSLVPSESAAERLLEEARAADAAGLRIGRRRAHEWFCVHAANTGIAGRRVLAGALEEERDPVRRLDLLWAATAEPDELAREVAWRVADDERAQPLERVFAAWQLANLGPAEEVAPRLERLALRLEGDARRAIQCLLHFWF